MSAEGKLYRYIDQVCFFVREEGRNEIHMQVVDGNLMVRELPKGLIARMKRHGISEPFDNPMIQHRLEGEEYEKE